MSFAIEWLTFYAAVMFAMSVDNIFWISASPEYKYFKKWTLNKKLAYIMKDRILAVLKHWRDIVPALLTSFILAAVL